MYLTKTRIGGERTEGSTYQKIAPPQPAWNNSAGMDIARLQVEFRTLKRVTERLFSSCLFPLSGYLARRCSASRLLSLQMYSEGASPGARFQVIWIWYGLVKVPGSSTVASIRKRARLGRR